MNEEYYGEKVIEKQCDCAGCKMQEKNKDLRWSDLYKQHFATIQIRKRCEANHIEVNKNASNN